MNIQDARKGMKVQFGRPNGEKTVAEIIKVNPSRAKVKTLEERGTGKGSAIGSIWVVAYSALTPIDGSGLSLPVAEAPRALEYSPLDPKNGLYECLSSIHNQLSPENLHADGERPFSQVKAMMQDLQRQQKGLHIAIGREISENEIFAWELSRRAYQNQQAQGAKA